MTTSFTKKVYQYHFYLLKVSYASRERVQVKKLKGNKNTISQLPRINTASGFFRLVVIFHKGNVEKSRQRRSRPFAVLTYWEYAPRVKTAAALLDELF